MWNHVFGGDEHEKWLFNAAGVQPVLRKSTSPHQQQPLRFLTETWLTQLAKRRCVWCWDRSTEQLHAMWKLYGARGVAVFSTVGKIRKALKVGGASQGIISPVTYVPLPSRARPGDVWEQFGLMRPKNLPHPYLYKDSGFRIEEEVRFVLAANPVATDTFGGAITNIFPQSMISNFEVSREIPSEERRCISVLARKCLNGPEKLPSEDAESAFPEWEPFLSEPNLPPRIFPDLDN